MVFALVAVIIWKSQSRIGMIALGILLLSFFILRYGTVAKKFMYRLPKAVVLLVAGVLVAGMCYAGWYLFNLKKLSAITRLMTLDIAKEHIADHVWLGTGPGRVSWHYPQWQAQYFATHPHPPNYYFLSAGESYYLFNEYVELFFMIGLPGFIVFVFILIWFFTTRSIKYKALLQAAKLTVIAILVCGISSYSFHVTFLLLLFAFCFAIAAIVNENKWKIFRKLNLPDQLYNAVSRAIPVILIVIAGFAVYSAFGQWQAKRDWDKLRNRLDGDRAGIIAEYGRLYEVLSYDGKFLTDYGMTLLEDSADCRKASFILEEAKKYFISRITIETLAKAYKKEGDFRKAIQNYEWLCHYLPNRFGTKLELLKLYELVGDTTKARLTAHMILSMPVKIESHEVERIKGETRSILNRLIDQ
ncbi:O-antigen ligase family protein [Niastella populi]|nr:O-antigen ligase family protein [Niastella populi]